MSANLKPARAMLALIALAELPMPDTIRFYNEHDVAAEAALCLDFATVADGIAWATHLKVRNVEPYVNTDGNRYLGQLSADHWHGWRLQLHACDRLDRTDSISADEAAALTTLAAAA